MRGEKSTGFGSCERRVKNRPWSEALAKGKSVNEESEGHCVRQKTLTKVAELLFCFC